jgi:uncharacterized protein
VSAIADAVALLGVGALAGIVSTVASLASVVSYPALLAFGLSPVSANVTNTVALMFTGLGAAAGSRPELAGQAHRVRTLGLLTAAGGGAGAAVLLLTPPRGFEYAAPLLIALGSVLLLLRRDPPPDRSHGEQGDDGPTDRASSAIGAAAAAGSRAGWLSRAAVFGVALYIGYFGAAGGIIMLAALTRMYVQPLARTNALKNVISGLANAVAGIGFAIFGPVRWAAAVPLAAGFLIGGWIGPSIVRRLPAGGLRIFIGLCGFAVAIRLGISAY